MSTTPSTPNSTPPEAPSGATATPSIQASASTPYSDAQPSRAEVDRLPGDTLLEFGANHCGWCRAAQPHILAALQGHADLRHLKVQDGAGRPLGRSLRVKLWPTLVLLRSGVEAARVVRPADAQAVRAVLSSLPE